MQRGEEHFVPEVPACQRRLSVSRADGQRIMLIMTMSLPDGEPEAGPWRAEPVSAVFGTLAEAGSPVGRPRVIVVDGRSSGGKTTLAGQLAACEAQAHVVHTDDIAWHHSMHDPDTELVVASPVSR